jgi:hypothetical protein
VVLSVNAAENSVDDSGCDEEQCRPQEPYVFQNQRCISEQEQVFVTVACRS